MKKFLGTALAAVMAVTSCFSVWAAQETPLEKETETPYTLVKIEIPETEEASVRYALLGEGDGLEAFDLYAPEDGTYMERFEDFWEEVLELEPQITLTGDLEALKFEVVEETADNAERVIKTEISVNEEIAAEVEGEISFAILSESMGEVEPEIHEDGEVYIWEPECIRQFTEEAYKYMMICDECEALSDGSCGHGTLISEFCKEGHTKDMGDPMHHCDTCGADYPCSQSNGHTTCIKCGNAWCYTAKGTHFTSACGHRGCEIYGNESAHAKCKSCGEYLCNGKSHKHAAKSEACGVHKKGTKGNHALAVCGVKDHYACDGDDHSAASCGIECHYVCDGDDHSVASCGTEGHYVCDEEDHSAASCGITGHYECDGEVHAVAVECFCG